MRYNRINYSRICDYDMLISQSRESLPFEYMYLKLNVFLWQRSIQHCFLKDKSRQIISLSWCLYDIGLGWIISQALFGFLCSLQFGSVNLVTVLRGTTCTHISFFFHKFNYSLTVHLPWRKSIEKFHRHKIKCIYLKTDTPQCNILNVEKISREIWI